MTQMNLGTALKDIGGRKRSTASLKEAIAAHRKALEVFTRDRAPFQWAVAQNNLGNTLRYLAEFEFNIAYLEEAIAAFHGALEIFEPEADHDARLTRENLALAETLMAKHSAKPN